MEKAKLHPDERCVASLLALTEASDDEDEMNETITAAASTTPTIDRLQPERARSSDNYSGISDEKRHAVSLLSLSENDEESNDVLPTSPIVGSERLPVVHAAEAAATAAALPGQLAQRQAKSTGTTHSFGEHRPGAFPVRGVEYQSSVSEEDDDSEGDDYEDEAPHTEISQDGTKEPSFEAAHVSGAVEATLVSQDLVVNAEVVEDPHTAESRVLQLLLCIQDPNHHVLDEKSIFKSLREFPELFRRKYRMSNGENTMSAYPLNFLCRLNPPVKLVKLVHEAFPSAISEPDEWKRLPIHRACGWRASVVVVRYLLDAYPESISIPDDHGGMPLHHACQFPSNERNLVQYLVSQFPEAIKHQRKDGNLPLHLALRAEMPETFVNRLLSLYPESASIKNAEGWLPLHKACRNKASLSTIELLLQHCPEGARTVYPKDKDGRLPDGRLPLHVACEQRLDSNIIRSLMRAFPEGVQHADALGMYPLHCAAASHRDAVLRVLLRAFPAAAERQTTFGSLPLHYALKKRRSDNFVMELVDAYQDGVSMADPKGRIPLHQLLRKADTYSFATIERFVKLDTEAVRKRSAEGLTALYLACNSGAKEDVVNLLLHHYPEAASICGAKKRLPLHQVCSLKEADLGTIRSLISAYPSGVRSKDKSGNLPLHVACAAESPSSVIALLLEAFPQAAESSNGSGRLPLHIACASRTASSVDTVRRLLEAHPDGRSTRAGSGTKSAFPLHVACANNAPTAVIQQLLVKCCTAGRRSGPDDDGDDSSSSLLLLQARDAKGDTALDIAIRSNCSSSTIEYLEMTLAQLSS